MVFEFLSLGCIFVLALRICETTLSPDRVLCWGGLALNVPRISPPEIGLRMES